MRGSGKTMKKQAALAALTTFGLLAPAAAQAQIYLVPPVYPSAPIEGSDPLVGLPLPGATPAEYRAHMLWNLRSGLNVAALQCQFSPFLRTVPNYNAILAHHNRELAAAYTALEGYFRRVAGRDGPRRFDLYSTQTYNGFSAAEAQLGFCQTASRIGKEALATPKGQFGQLAANRMREFRASLIPVGDSYNFTHAQVRLTPIALSPRDCASLERRERQECERQR